VSGELVRTEEELVRRGEAWGNVMEYEVSEESC